MKKGELLDKSNDYQMGYASGMNGAMNFIYEEAMKEFGDNEVILSFLEQKHLEYEKMLFEVGYNGLHGYEF